ncbi:hypothetical protein [Chitinophaga sancti]|uniref:hypothetical protein n=1 Tax=Chitinophaga sancti TaxID=1004 RepID=UPI003F794CC1
MKTSYKRLLQIISILLLLFIPWMPTWSCGPENAVDDYRFVMFEPQLSRFPGLGDLNYNYHLNVLRDGDPQKKDYQRNCREWQQELGGRLTDIYNIQYEMAPDDFLYAYRHHAWENSKGNSFLQALLKPANLSFLDYMAFAKQVEFSQFGDYDPWQTGDDNGGQEQAEILYSAGKQAFAKTTNTFLKERYAFQLEKLMYYGAGRRERDSLVPFYDRYLKGHATIVADWGLLYYANMQHNPLMATKLLCETFERSEEKKAFIYNKLRGKDLDTLLQREPNIPVAWFIRGLKNPGRALPVIQALHGIAPRSKYLPMLVVREVNKVEDWLMSPAVLGFNSRLKVNEYEMKRNRSDYTTPDTTYEYYAQKNRRNDLAYLRIVRGYLESIVSKADSNHILYALAVAHLYNMDGEYAKAAACLKNLDTRNNILFRRQWITEDILASMHIADIKSDSVKNVFGAQLNELIKLGASVSKPEFESEYDEDLVENGFSYLLLLLSRQYEKQQDIVTAGLLFQKANVLVNGYYGWTLDDDTTKISYRKIAYFDQHATPEDLERLLAFKRSKQHTAFEKFIMPKVWAPEDFYRDVQLSLLVRQQRFEEALMVAERMDKYFWRDNYEYSAYLTHKYIGSADFLVPGEKLKHASYTIASKRAILKDIVLLRDSLKLAPQNAVLYYRMGNALYNISFGGRCWMLANYGKGYGRSGDYDYRPGWQEYDHNELNRRHQANYYKCEAAMCMYRKALANGQGQKELCAKVLLMMSVCDKDRADYVRERKYSDLPIYRYNLAGDDAPYHSHYLDVLKKKYGHTNMYAESKMMCPDVH